MQNDIMFDNIYIGHSVEDAEKFADETFNEKHPIEQLVELADAPKEEDKPKSPTDIAFLEDPINYVKEKLDLFITIAKSDPVEAIKLVPEAAGGILAVFITFIALLIGIVTIGTTTTPPPAVKKAAANVKAAATDAKDKVVDAATTGADKAQAELNKRSTRSSN